MRHHLTRATVAGAALVLGGLASPAAPSAAAAPHEERVLIGTSVRGEPIRALHRWRDGPSRAVLVIGSMHGDERAGLRVVRRLRDARLPAGMDLWLVPTINPDGTAADRRTNARRVDLNRNFPRRWTQANRGTGTWSGPWPASEPETQAVMAFLRRVRPHTTVVVHQPLLGVDSYRAKSMALVRRLSRETGLPIGWFDCGGGCHGTLVDWHNARLEGRAVTLELGRTASDHQVTRVARGLLRATTPSWALEAR